MTKRRVIGLSCLGVLAASAALSTSLAGSPARPAQGVPSQQADPAVERAREQVQMLDALYKTAVVSITGVVFV